VGRVDRFRPATDVSFPRSQPQQPGSEKLADLGQALGGGHPVRVEGVLRQL
jgi:hypothetical protein